MAPLVAGLSDADIHNLGAYFHSLPYNMRVADAVPNADLAAKGKSVALQHRCASCHKDNYLGERAAAAIADQREDYLVKALTDYRSAAQPSVGVAAMTGSGGFERRRNCCSLALYRGAWIVASVVASVKV
jgi:cytochrome c553